MSGEELLPQRSGDSLAVHKARLIRKHEDEDEDELEELESSLEDIKLQPRIDSIALARGRLSVNTDASSPTDSPEDTLSRKSGGLKAKAVKPPKPKSPKKQGVRTRFAGDSPDSETERPSSITGALSNVGRKLSEAFSFGPKNPSRSSSMVRSEEPAVPEPQAVEPSAESTHVKFGDVTLCDDVVEQQPEESSHQQQVTVR